MVPFNPLSFRRCFPALHQAGVYLDSAATALKPQVVINATQQFYANTLGSVHRGQYHSAQTLTEQFEKTRQQVATLINAPDCNNIVWTSGTTEAINLVAQSYARLLLQAGDEIIVCEAEHHANLIPWLIVAEQTGARIIRLPLDSNKLPDLNQLALLLTERTRLLALGQMSNVTGGCPDLKRAIQLAHKAGAVVVVDGAQGIVHHLVDVQALDIDFYAFSAHKLYGPTGIGVLYGKTQLLAQMPPWKGGGKMLTQAAFSGFTMQKPPYRFEAGTPNIAGVLGFSAALTWLAEQDILTAERYCVQLAENAEHQLAALPGFRSFRCANSSLLSFDFDSADIHHNDIALLLAEQNIALRAGQHCAQPLMEALGVTGLLRASFAPYNNQQDVDALVAALHYALSLLID